MVTTCASSGEASVPSESSLLSKDTMGKVALAALVIALGVANRVLYKMALLPLNDYVFFLAQLTTFGYVAVYFSALFTRYKLGLVTDKMLSLPKGKFALMGFLEAVSLTLGFIGASQLPGALLPVLSQLLLFWQLIFSSWLLGRKYSVGQLLSAGCVVAGVVLASSTGLSATLASSTSLSGSQTLYLALFVGSLIGPALSTILKEWVFRDAKEKLGGKDLDLFVVNSFGSGFQALFVLLQLPLLASLRGIAPSQLPGYLADGWRVFIGAAPNAANAPSPLLPLAYVAVNLVFNIAALRLMRATSAVTISFVLALTVPITVLVFSLPLPYLPYLPSVLGGQFMLGLAILLVGLAGYTITSNNKAKK